MSKEKVEFKIDTLEGLLEEILFCLNQLPNTKIKSYWFKDTYELCSEITKQLKQKT